MSMGEGHALKGGSFDMRGLLTLRRGGAFMTSERALVRRGVNIIGQRIRFVLIGVTLIAVRVHLLATGNGTPSGHWPAVEGQCPWRRKISHPRVTSIGIMTWLVIPMQERHQFPALETRQCHRVRGGGCLTGVCPISSPKFILA